MNEAALFQRLTELLTRYRQTRGEGPVVDYLDPQTLAQRLELERPAAGDWEQILRWLELYLAHSVRTDHPRFLNRMWAGANLPSILGEMVVAVNNASACTWEGAPVATLMERYMLRTMLELVGFEDGEGQMTTGSSAGNLVAMLAARNTHLENAHQDGLWQEQPLTAFVSAEAHYSLDKAANVLGLGTRHLVKVPVDTSGAMDPQALEAALERCVREGKRPFFVAATLGTTVRGAFDPLPLLIELRERYGFWLHGDGAWGGAVLLDDELRKRFAPGVEALDSLTWDFHKMAGSNLMCNMLLVNRRPGLFRCVCSAGEHDYLFREEEPTHALDMGVGSLQCGRRVDALKWFLDWKYHGREGLARRVRHYLALAEHAERRIQTMPRLELAAPRISFNVCFRYQPPAGEDADQFNLALRHRLHHSGQAMVGVARLDGRVVLRLLITHPDQQPEDVDAFLTLVQTEGDRMTEQHA